MSIVLSSKTQKLLEDRLKAGAYTSPDDLVNAALEALDQLTELDEPTLDAIDRAEDQIEAGSVHQWRDVRDQIRSEFNKK